MMVHRRHCRSIGGVRGSSLAPRCLGARGGRAGGVRDNYAGMHEGVIHSIIRLHVGPQYHRVTLVTLKVAVLHIVTELAEVAI
jgi:hypothetical protein